MTYDKELTEQFRTALSGLPDISEKRMMGEICFFHQGNMIGGCDRSNEGDRRFMFRIRKKNEAKAFAGNGATPVIFGGGRRMGRMVLSTPLSANRLTFSPF